MLTSITEPGLLGYMIGHWELIVVALVALLLFGHRLPSLMRSLGSGITQFKKGMNDDPADDDPALDEKPASKGEKHVGA